jgi:hypothetical protein
VEDGRIGSLYPLAETPDADYSQRTEWNVRDSDATLVLTRERPRGGTAFTIAVARRLGRPLLVVDLDETSSPDEVRRWIEAGKIAVLNVAGPRESQYPGIGQ